MKTIYYTGDLANIPGWFRVTKTEEDKFGTHIYLKECESTLFEDDKPREFVISPSAFDESPGQRFKWFAQWERERGEKLAELKAALKARQ